MESFMTRLEIGYREEISALKKDIHTVQTRTTSLEPMQAAQAAITMDLEQCLKLQEDLVHTLPTPYFLRHRAFVKFVWVDPTPLSIEQPCPSLNRWAVQA